MHNRSTYLSQVLERATHAAAIFSELDQATTNNIVKSVCEKAFSHRVELAKMAWEETGMGKWEDKVIKNAIASRLVYENIKDLKTVGIISENEETGITEIAQPIGPILAIIPVTNPTSTVLFKILIALKTRNPIIISPHRRATKSSIEAARLCYEAALAADAPEFCIQWVEHDSREMTQALMSHPKLALILATGGPSLVKSTYSSGTPAFGVGAGNIPVYVEKTADLEHAAAEIIVSKAFDNGILCSSEQSLVVDQEVAPLLKVELKKRGAYFLSSEETIQLERIVYDKENAAIRTSIIGKSAVDIARLAGIVVPADTPILIAPLKGVGDKYPLSAEILAPLLAYYEAHNFNEAVKICLDLNYFGGVGHSVSIFSKDEEKIKKFSLVMDAGRILVNMPSAQGAMGGIYNSLSTSFTLGCGTYGKNITTDNITAKHLLNIQRVCDRRVSEAYIKLMDDINKTKDNSGQRAL